MTEREYNRELEAMNNTDEFTADWHEREAFEINEEHEAMYEAVGDQDITF